MRRFVTLMLLASLLLVGLRPVSAQVEWQEIAPLGESFTVRMPTHAKAVSRLIPLSEKDSIPARVFYSLVPGRRYAIVSLARTSSTRFPALSSFTEFLRAIELSFPGDSGQTRRLTFDQDLSEASREVKQYRVQLGDYSGVARFIGSEKSFYAQMVIGADVNDADAQRFLTSFRVGQTNEDPEATNVISISEGGGTNPDLPPEPWPQRFSAISGGVLNGKAQSLAQPEYPQAARENHDEGLVKVRIVIDELGSVISAEAIEGPETLRQAAVDAAFKSRFSPTRLSGQPVKVSGVILYNFVRQ